MPGGGIRAAAEISKAVPQTVVLMLTVSEEREDLLAAVRAGAAGYVLKDSAPDDLCNAIHSVLAGEGFLASRLVAPMMNELRNHGADSTHEWGFRQGLSYREGEVLALLRAGRTTSEIAYDLSISAVTVRRHISATLQKLHVRDRKELLMFVERSTN
jgi:DNA-binding NarL/FixJ family response regulator